MAANNTLPVGVLKKSFVFGDEVLWSVRPRNHFLTEDRHAAFNSQWAGKPAFTSSNGRGYAVTTMTYQGRRYRLLRSRVVFAVHACRWPEGHVDHINGDTSDDRPENLRDATNSENMRNCRKSVANTSGVTGVYWFKPRSCWTAQIGRDNKSISLGYFHRKELAVAARKGAEKALGYSSRHGGCDR